MGQSLAVASERTELDFASRADSQQSNFPLEDGSMRMSYLDKVRNISLVSAGGASGSSWSARSSNYSSYCSTVSIGSHVSYSGASSCSSTAAGSSIVPTTTREVACLMVKDGYIMALIRMFGREPGVLERWFSELDVDWVLRINSKDHGRSSQLEGADDGHLVRNLVPRWTRALALMIEALTTATDVAPAAGGVLLPGRPSDGRKPPRGVLLQEAIPDARQPPGGVLLPVPEAFSDERQPPGGVLLQEAFSDARRPSGGVLLQEAISDADATTAGSDHEPAGGVLLQEAISDADATTTGSDHEPDWLRLARFAEAAISKMLAFVDALVGANHRCRTEKLQALINVLACVSGASDKYHLAYVAPPKEMRSLVMKINGVFSGKMRELHEAVTSMISDARDVILRGDSWETIPRNGEIHETTRLCADYVYLSREYQSALHFLTKLCNDIGYDMILDTIPKLENQLEEKSQLIPDRSLRYIFLLNNFHFMQQVLESIDISDRLLFRTTHKVESYLKSYLDVSWEPVLSCLHNETPLCFPKHSSLAKFDSEFQRACSAQKLWKVPDPGLRKRLRKAIVGRVLTGYNNFLRERPGKEEDCSGDPTRSSSQDLEDMLNELFEG